MDWTPITIITGVGVAAFMCGAALFYLAMNRTRKHRIATSNAPE